MANRHYHFKFNTEKDQTYIQRLDAQENMQGYIRRLILSDIAADGLREMIQWPESDGFETPVTGIDKLRARYDFMNKNCPVAESGGAIETCPETCPYRQVYPNDCSIEDAFESEWSSDHGKE